MTPRLRRENSVETGACLRYAYVCLIFPLLLAYAFVMDLNDTQVDSEILWEHRRSHIFIIMYLASCLLASTYFVRSPRGYVSDESRRRRGCRVETPWRPARAAGEPHGMRPRALESRGLGRH